MVGGFHRRSGRGGCDVLLSCEDVFDGSTPSPKGLKSQVLTIPTFEIQTEDSSASTAGANDSLSLQTEWIRRTITEKGVHGRADRQYACKVVSLARPPILRTRSLLETRYQHWPEREVAFRAATGRAHALAVSSMCRRLGLCKVNHPMQSLLEGERCRSTSQVSLS